MKEKFCNLSTQYFKEGYSCSEAIAKATVTLGLANEDLVSIATSFSGGMSSRCVCGAVAGAQLVIGLLHGKNKDNSARVLAKNFYERFTQKHKVACCKVLSSGFEDFHSQERKTHCVNMVYDASEILCEILKEADKKTLI